MKQSILENLSSKMKKEISVRRYNLPDMISESYRTYYACEKNSNLQKLVESHLDDVRKNPKDIDRLSRQLSILKEVGRLVESNDLKDEDLVDKKAYDTVAPKKERVIHEECDSSKGKRLNDRKPVDESENLSLKDAKACAEDLEETDNPDLTDEEVEELAKHLEEIRKGKKTPPAPEEKKEVEESATPRKGLKVSSKREAKKITEAEKYEMRYYVDIMYTEGTEDVESKMEHALTQAGFEVINVFWSEDVMTDSKKVCEEDVCESYEGLQNFKKLSESKAFYKTFKKLDTKLKEGTALTRQESIDLYKAANSAMTHLSVELEHNPEFLDTFKECTTILSRDVDSILGSLKEGKGPSKKTMKSLSKFSEALLNESDEEDGGFMKHYDASEADDEETKKAYAEYKRTHFNYCAPDRRHEYAKFYKEDDSDEPYTQYKLRFFVGEDDEGRVIKLDHEETFKDRDSMAKRYNEFISNLNGREYWLLKAYTKRDSERKWSYIAGFPSRHESIMNPDFIDGIDEAEDEKDLPPIEDEESEIVAPEESEGEEMEEPEMTEEDEEFSQEYADARRELHDELAEKYEDSEDPAVQDKLEADRVDVAILNGEDPYEESAEEEVPEESPEDEIEDTEDIPEEDEDDIKESVDSEDDITPDELAELKKHLKEMRAARKES